MRTDLGISPQYVPRGKENNKRHDWHFRQFRPTLANSRNKKRHPDHSEQKASPEHKCEVEEPWTNGFQHGLRTHGPSRRRRSSRMPKRAATNAGRIPKT